MVGATQLGNLGAQTSFYDSASWFLGLRALGSGKTKESGKNFSIEGVKGKDTGKHLRERV